MLSTGDDFEVRHYDRLTPLTVENSPLGCYSQVQPGEWSIKAFVIVYMPSNDGFT